MRKRSSRTIKLIETKLCIVEHLILQESSTWYVYPAPFNFNLTNDIQILMMHIKQTLPEIKGRISSSLQKYSAELAQLGDSILGNSANIILNIITEFSNEYRTVLDGNNQEISSTELSGGARISFVFHELYSNGVKAIDPFDQFKDIDIRTLLYNSSGPSPALFVGTTAFENIVKKQIERLEDPSLKCVNLVYDELVRILTQLLQKPVSLKGCPPFWYAID